MPKNARSAFYFSGEYFKATKTSLSIHQFPAENITTCGLGKTWLLTEQLGFETGSKPWADLETAKLFRGVEPVLGQDSIEAASQILGAWIVIKINLPISRALTWTIKFCSFWCDFARWGARFWHFSDWRSALISKHSHLLCKSHHNVRHNDQKPLRDNTLYESWQWTDISFAKTEADGRERNDGLRRYTARK